MRKITEITHSTHIAFPPILLRRKSSGGQASRLPPEDTDRRILPVYLLLVYSFSNGIHEPHLNKVWLSPNLVPRFHYPSRRNFLDGINY